MPTAEASTPGADVADAGHLQQPLDGAVLAPRPVQQREDHVDLAERAGHGAGLVHDELAGPVLPGQRDRRARRVDLGQPVARGDRQPAPGRPTPAPTGRRG